MSNGVWVESSVAGVILLVDVGSLGGHGVWTGHRQYWAALCFLFNISVSKKKKNCSKNSTSYRENKKNRLYRMFVSENSELATSEFK